MLTEIEELHIEGSISFEVTRSIVLRDFGRPFWFFATVEVERLFRRQEGKTEPLAPFPRRGARLNLTFRQRALAEICAICCPSPSGLGRSAEGDPRWPPRSKLPL